MLKNNRGITMVALTLTIVILLIITAVSVNTAVFVVNDIRVGRIISNMTLVQKKVEVIYEEYQFENDNQEVFVGDKIGNINELEGVDVSEQEKQKIKAELGITDISDLEWYKWTSETLKEQGLDTAMLEAGECFFVNYEYGEVIYSQGTSYEDSEDFYSLSGLKSIYTE